MRRGVPAARARRLSAPAALLARNLRVDFSVWDHRQRGECKVQLRVQCLLIRVSSVATAERPLCFGSRRTRVRPTRQKGLGTERVFGKPLLASHIYIYILYILYIYYIIYILYMIY